MRAPLLLPVVEPGTRALFFSGRRDLYCLVDEIDFDWAAQWQWKPIGSRRCSKLYAYRTTRAFGRHVSIWLHKQILLRAVGLPPHRDALIGDHLDGNSLNDRRGNLRWATPVQNFANLRGLAAVRMRVAIAAKDRNRVLGGARL